MRWNLLFYFFGAILVNALGNQESHPQIKIENGIIRGTINTSVKGRPFYAFKGIPYAKPPIGEQRFKDPIPVESWNEVWDASEYGSECLQYDFVTEKVRLHGDEDCLFVNVFTPKNPKSVGSLLDVIVFIHGGGFMYGTSYQYGPEILMDRDVVVVTLNYRLGPLGFLSTEDDVVPGNMGLKDQSMALKWIQKNIAAFGGNPKSVTITGCSAGGASVHYHYLSPLSTGLFARGMSLSGTSIVPWAQQEAALEKAKKIGAELGCPTTCSKKMIECLRKRPARRIVQLVDKFQVWHNNPFSPFAPVVEQGGSKPFLAEHPADALRAGRVQNIPWITSITTEEGNYPMAAVVTNPKLIKELDQRWDELAKYILDCNYTSSRADHGSIAKLAKQFYLQNAKSFGDNNAYDLIQMVGDRIFVIDIARAAKMQAAVSSAPVYFYKFSYRGRHSLSEDFSKTETDLGVAHGDDLAYTLKTFYMESGDTQEDRNMREVMLDFWTHFASTGKPNFRKIQFDQINPNQEAIRYLNIINPNEIRMDDEEDIGNIKFWDSLPINEPQIKSTRKIDEL